jgi:hypothetical protein
MGHISDVNPKAYAHHNLSITATPTEGPNAGVPFRFTIAESAKVDVGNKVKALMGLGAGPVAVVSSGAEPSWEIKMSQHHESARFARHLGNPHRQFNMVFTWNRASIGTLSIKCDSCMVEKGFGFDSSHDGAPNDTISGKCVDVLHKLPLTTRFVSVVRDEQ